MRPENFRWAYQATGIGGPERHPLALEPGRYCGSMPQPRASDAAWVPARGARAPSLGVNLARGGTVTIGTDARRSLLLVALLLGACSGGGSEGRNGVRLKGRLPAAPAARTAAGPGTSAPLVAPLASAVKVIAINRTQTTIAPVVAGAFELDVEAGQPVAVILVGPGDSYLGFIAVRGTIPNVPLQAADPGVTQVDLGTLAAAGSVISPGIDPIGHGLTLSPEEISALVELGFVGRMVLANPDVDSDGAIDYLQGRQYSPQVALARPNGTIPALVGQPTTGVAYWSFGVNVVEEGVASYPPYAALSGPAGSGLDGLQCLAVLGPSGNALYGPPQLFEGSQPYTGTWTLGYRDRTLHFEVPDLSALASAAPTLVPTVTLNGDQTVQRISWAWRFADGSTSTTPATMAVNVGVQLNAGPGVARCPASNLGSSANGQVYAKQLPADALSHQLDCQNIPWGQVTSLQLMFIDVFNTNHFIVYGRP